MAIPDEKIDEIRGAADIVDVVGDYVHLKRSGSSYKGLCPFHDEKTPSFHVDPDKNVYYCFGCQKGGDIFSFVQEMETLGFLESARFLAERSGIPLPEAETNPQDASETESIYHALRFAARYFYHQLTQTERGQPALKYLKDRGFKAKTIKTFGLGYAPDEWDGLLNAAKKKQIDPETLEKAGLVIERKDGSGHYDRYRGRVIFPIFSHVGKVLGFGGRILDTDADQPKYINSPETKVYNKSKVLYGLHQAKSSIRDTGEALLVEGYTDVIALHQAGVTNAVASSGTALTTEQVQMLDRYAKRILLLYDADEAGSRAAVRGMDLVLEEGLGAYAVELPEGSDPDSYVHENGGEAFRTLVERKRKDMPTFKYQRAERNGDLDTPEGQAETMREVVATIAKLPDTLMQETYLRRASEVLGIPDIRLHEVLEQERGQQQSERARQARREERRQRSRQQASEVPPAAGPDQRPEAPPHTDDDALETIEPFAHEEPTHAEQAGPLPEEKVLLRLMLEQGMPMVEFILSNMALDEFTDGPPRRLVERLIKMYEDDRVAPQRILEGEYGADLQSLAASVMVDEYTPSQNWTRKQINVPRYNQEPYEAGASAMTLLKLDRVNEAIDAQKNRVYRADQSGDDDALRNMQSELMALYDLRKRIEQREFLQWNEDA